MARRAGACRILSVGQLADGIVTFSAVGAIGHPIGYDVEQDAGNWVREQRKGIYPDRAFHQWHNIAIPFCGHWQALRRLWQLSILPNIQERIFTKNFYADLLDYRSQASLS